MKLPKVWRKKRASGKFYGSYHTTVDGTDVNLRTSDANEALERAKQAHTRGRRNFVDEIDEAAAAADGQQGQGSAGFSPPLPPGGSTPPPATSQPAPAVVPDAVIPPAPRLLPAMSADDARAEAEATNDAAAEDAGDAGAASASSAPAISPDVLKGFLAQGGEVIVELQLQLQAFCIKKGLKRQAGEIDPDSPMRKMAAQAWAAQLAIWFPDDKMLPPWALALILPAMCIPMQIATATPIPKEDAASEAAPEAKAAA